MRLRLINFKSYADETVEFDLISSFIGDNGHGKTNIFRALKIVCHHEPWPERWLRHGTTSGMIELELDGVIVRRRKTKKTETTEIQVGDRIEILEGMVAATSKVRESLGFHKVVLDNPKIPADLNFVPVFSSPFLILDTPATAHRKLTAITGGHELELARKNLLKQTNKIKDQKEKLDSDIKTTEESLKTKEKEIALLECKFPKIEKAQNTLDGAKVFLDQIERLIEDLSNLPSTEQLQNKLSAAEQLSGAYLVFQEKLGVLFSLLKLTSERNNIFQLEDALTIAKQKEEVWRVRHKEVLKRLGVCPTCGTKIK